MKKYLTFLWDCFRLSFVGDWRYHLWMTILTLIALAGFYAYCQQLVHGLVTTGMTDQVSWGLYIANFTYLVGLAAAAAMLVIPVYVYRNMHLHDVVIFGELLAVAVDHHVPAVRHGRPGPPRPLHAPVLAIQLPDLDADLGRDRAERLPAAEPAHLRLPDLLRLLRAEAVAGVLRAVCVHRDRLGGQHSHGDGLSVRRAGWPAVLELGDHRAALPGQRLRGRPGVHHPDAAGRATVHAASRSATRLC